VLRIANAILSALTRCAIRFELARILLLLITSTSQIRITNYLLHMQQIIGYELAELSREAIKLLQNSSLAARQCLPVSCQQSGPERSLFVYDLDLLVDQLPGKPVDRHMVLQQHQIQSGSTPTDPVVTRFAASGPRASRVKHHRPITFRRIRSPSCAESFPIDLSARDPYII
jgi:hypothetical protein